MKVDLFIPCFIDQLFPDTAENTMQLLKELGCDVRYLKEQTCCGQLFYNSGHWDEAGRLAKKFLNLFSDADYIVSPGASCTGFVKHHYQKLDLSTSEKVTLDRLRGKIFELSDFLVNVLNVEQLNSSFEHKITYHDACSALREYGIYSEPRKLLGMVKGLELVEMPETDVCCGFGGTFSIKHSAISSAMVEQKLENALSTGAEYIVSTEASCLMNMDSYIKKQNLPIKIIHLADVLSSGI